ncbi:hypothetical protein GXM_05022 [Nostoc sphaeroides CCNUC1]|uniref:Uncharacterized protein n=1 Tax=Nostoc sphaeroides CCNUC1 TaxID=2653204 RepID=A0A5P8W4F1_9NOSO|nr:hypothetical protein GXM_05022 [Nostoc sphaeroides CCNUC1]
MAVKERELFYWIEKPKMAASIKFIIELSPLSRLTDCQSNLT